MLVYKIDTAYNGYNVECIIIGRLLNAFKLCEWIFVRPKCTVRQSWEPDPSNTKASFLKGISNRGGVKLEAHWTSILIYAAIISRYDSKLST